MFDTLKNLISRDETYAAGNAPQKRYALSKSLEDDDQLSKLPKRRKYHYSS
ncbi:hypothetical protein OROGR_025440 [Orobanche gracilis]